MKGTTHIYFPTMWIEGPVLERALGAARAEEGDDTRVEYHFPRGCKVIVDAGARLLSLINQQIDDGYAVTLAFEDPDGALGYLNRAGFFRSLPTSVRVLPDRPDDRVLMAREGTSNTLVEFRAISATDRAAINDVPRTLSTKLCAAYDGPIGLDRREGSKKV